MRKTTLLTVAAATLLALAACSSGSSSPPSAQAAGAVKSGAHGKTVAYFAPSLGISYWQWVGYGVQEQAAALGMKYVSYNANNDPGQQLANMHTAIVDGVSAIVIGPVSSTSVPPLLQLAQQNHIPIAFAGIGPPPGLTDFTSSVTADNKATGVAEGKFVCDAAKKLGGNQVGMLSLPLDRENAQKYLAGSRQAFQADGCQLVQIIQTHGLTVGEAVAETNDLLTTHPNIKGIYGMYDEAGTGAAKVLAQRGLTGKVALATADGSPATVALLRQGALQGLFLQEAVGQGIDGTTQVYDALTGKAVTKLIPLLEPLVTPQNIGQPAIQQTLRRVYPPSAGSY
jgi:ribose transport system substrate-binding protein